ncbi:MAG: PHP domain-containing protein [Erysipelotrichia bacterium]|nr:PHP domain-containing protein [Erysipelotrichia bacterium]NCC53969.1 PHP domain-containing protein [Erysipelotrichia bacterium]
MNTIDLHMHSKHSLDGEKEVQELINIAKQNKLETIAIADHNTCLAYHDHYDTKGIKLISAIELDCSFQDKDFHLLGYFVDPFNLIWKNIHTCVNEMERTAGIERLQYIREQMKIIVDQSTLDALCPNGIYEAESVCEVALQNEENRNNPYLKEYFAGGTHSVSPLVDFYWEYCAKGKIAYSPIHFMKMEEAIKQYRKQNALIVLAHPGNNVKEDKQLMKDIIALGIDGIEVYSSYHNDEQIAFYHQIAKEHQLLMTCGSDYHGKTKPHVIMGECHMPQKEEDKLKAYLNTYKNERDD